LIKIIIELWPHGFETNKMKLGEMKIANDGTGTPSKGNYYFDLFLKRKKVWKSGKITNFPRGNKNIFYLIKQCLNEVLK